MSRPSELPPPPDGEVIVALPMRADRIEPATRLRSTVLISSLAALEATGSTAAYFRALPTPWHEPVRTLVVGTWVDMALADAHYAACDTLGLSHEQAFENGRRSADRIQKSYFGTVLRAMGTTVTPWMMLARFPAFSERLLDGGASQVVKIGAKDARIDFHGLPIARHRYVRSGWCGLVAGTMELMLRKVYVRDVARGPSPSSLSMQLSWV